MHFFGGRLKRVFSYSVYRKTLYAYALSFFVLVALILGSTFAMMLSNIKSQSMEASGQLLTQLVSSAEKIKTTVDDVTTLLAGYSDTMRFAKNRTESKLDNYQLYTRLTQVKMAYSHIENIQVINMDSGSLVSVLGISDYTADQAKALVKVAVEEQRFVVSRQLEYYSRRVVDVVSFLQVLPYDNCAIIIDVKADWFQYDLVNDSGRTAYVIDGAGNTVTSNVRMSMGGEPLSGYLYRLIENAEGEAFSHTDTKARKILFFDKAESLDWWFVDIQDYSEFYRAFQNMAQVFFGVALCFLLFCVIISVVFNRRIRKPLIQLANKYRGGAGETAAGTADELRQIDMAIAKVEHERYLGENHLKNQIVRAAILGEVLPFSLTESRTSALWQEYSAPYYAVMLLKIQPVEEIAEDKLAAEMQIFRYTVCNIAEELFSPVFSCKACELEQNTVGLMIMLKTDQVPDDYVICFRELKGFLKKEIGILASGALGMTVDKEKDICASYRKAHQFLELGGFTDRDDLIDGTGSATASYQEKNDRLVESIVDYARLNYADPDLSLKRVSQNFGLSTAYLGKIFKSVQGEGFSAFLTAYRLEQSKALLLETNRTVSEIAQQIGFTNPTYYSTLFKNSYGMTPSAFRTRK